METPARADYRDIPEQNSTAFGTVQTDTTCKSRDRRGLQPCKSSEEKVIRMRELEQRTIFLREHIMLPEGIALAGEPICEGWVILQSGDAMWLDKAIRDLGWNSNVLTKMYWRSGYANRAQDAIDRAAQLALRKVNERFNAAEIGHIIVAKHLWFYVARLGIFSRYIQEGPFVGGCDELSAGPVQMTFESRHEHV